MSEREHKFIPHKGKVESEVLPNSFEAVLANYQGVMECDLVLLKDGNIAIVHPRDVGKSVEDIEALDLDGLEQESIPSDDPERYGRAIPLLPELAGFASDTDTRLMMELKASDKEHAFAVAQKAIEQLKKMNEAGAFASHPEFVDKGFLFQSTSAEVLAHLQECADEAGIAVATNFALPTDEGWAAKTPVFDGEAMKEFPDEMDWTQKGLEHAKEHGIKEIEFDSRLITPELVNKAHDAGMKIGSGLVKDEARKQELEAMGVDYVLFEA